MLIGLNGQNLLSQEPAGPEKYSYNIYKALAKVDKNNSYILYLSQEPSEEFKKDISQNNPNFSFKVLKSNLSWTQVSLSKEIFKDKPQILFSPTHTLPIVKPKKTKCVSMIHGLEFKYNVPKNNLQKLLMGKSELYTCLFSDRIIVPSEATRKDIVEKKYADDKLINTVYEGVDNIFYKRSADEIEEVRNRYSINTQNYLLFIGTIQPRKNLPRTIEAFSLLLKNNNRLNISLVIVGKKGWNFDESLESAKKFNVDNRVNYLGRVPDSKIPALISGAKALINFSFQEGFGLPLIESMACETALCVSDIPSFNEIAQDNAYYANAGSVEDIENKLLQVLSNDNSEIIYNNLKRVKNFTWENSATQILAIFEDSLKNSQSHFRILNPAILFKVILSFFN